MLLKTCNSVTTPVTAPRPSAVAPQLAPLPAQVFSPELQSQPWGHNILLSQVQQRMTLAYSSPFPPQPSILHIATT